VSAFRYFEVSGAGVKALDIEEYSRRVLVTAPLADGSIGLVGGTVDRPAGAKRAVSGFDAPVPPTQAEVTP